MYGTEHRELVTTKPYTETNVPISFCNANRIPSDEGNVIMVGCGNGGGGGTIIIVCRRGGVCAAMVEDGNCNTDVTDVDTGSGS